MTQTPLPRNCAAPTKAPTLLHDNRRIFAGGAGHIVLKLETSTEDSAKNVRAAMKNRRWMASMIAEAKKTEVEMPWARGARRAALIAKTSGPVAKSHLRASA